MVTLAELLMLIPNYIGAFAGFGALVVSWLAYRRSLSTKNESDAIALILAETLRELARPERPALRADTPGTAFADLGARLAGSVSSLRADR